MLIGALFAGPSADTSLRPVRVDDSVCDVTLVADKGTVGEKILRRMALPSQEQADRHIRTLDNGWVDATDGSSHCRVRVFVSETCSYKIFRLIIGAYDKLDFIKGGGIATIISDEKYLRKCFAIGHRHISVRPTVANSEPRIRSVALQLVAQLCK